MFRRLLRWGFHVAAALSLVLGLATAGLWVRGCFLADVALGFGPFNRGEPVGVRSDAGIIQVAVFRPEDVGFWSALGSATSSIAVGRCHWTWDRLGPSDTGWWFHLTSDHRMSQRGPYITDSIIVPCWAVVLATAILPVCWCRPIAVRRARRRSGRCLACGYDLRASKGRCPECGTPIPDTPARTRI